MLHSHSRHQGHGRVGRHHLGPDGQHTYSGSCLETTSMAMELRAILEGLRLAPSALRCRILTDYQPILTWVQQSAPPHSASASSTITDIIALLAVRHATLAIAHHHPLLRTAHQLARAAARAIARQPHSAPSAA